MKRMVFCLIWCLLIAGSAFADEGDRQSALGKAIDKVVGPFKGLFAGTEELDPIVVTPSRVPRRPYGEIFGTTILQSSKSVDVIDQEEIRKVGARSVSELLKGRVGVNVSDYTGTGKNVQVDIRGFGETAQSNVLVMIDGRRTNQVDISGTDWLQIDIDSIERIEIVRGPQSVLYGDNAVGGVINIITKRGAATKPEAGFSYETGSYHYNSYSGHALGGSRFLDYAVNISTAGTDGYRGNSDLERVDFTNTYTIKPAEYLNIRLDGGYHKDWFGMPGQLTDIQIDRNGWRACNKPGDRGKTEDGYATAGLDFFASGKSGDVTLSADIITRGRRSAQLNFFTPDWYEQNNHIETFGVTPKAIIEFVLLGINNRLLLGIDYYHYRDSITATNWSNMLFGDKRQKDLTNIEEETVGMYISESAELADRLTLSGGFRTECANYLFDQQYIVPSKNTRRSPEYGFDCGVNYRYNDTSALYANIARSFRFPAVDEWYQSTISVFGTISGGLNLDLEPQSGMSYELGIRDHTLKWLKMNADYFIMENRHELYYDPVNFVNMIYDRTMRQGMELESHILPVNALDIYIRYTYEKAFFVGSHFAGNEVPLVPNHKITSGITYTFANCVDISYIINYVGPRRFISDEQNLSRNLPGYLTNDVKLAYRKYGFEVFGALNNIFDCDYAEIGSYGQYYPANGRNFLIGLKQKF